MLSITVTIAVIMKTTTQIEGMIVIYYDEVGNYLLAIVAKMTMPYYQIRPVNWKHYLNLKTPLQRHFQGEYKFIIFIKITIFAGITIIIVGFTAGIVIAKKHRNLGHNLRRKEQNLV